MTGEAGAWRMYNVPDCLSSGWNPQWYLLLSSRVISPPARSLKDTDIPTPQTHNEDQEFSCQSILSFTDWAQICHLCVSLYRNVCLYVSEWLTEKQQGIASSDRWHIEGARTHQSEEQVLTRRPSLLILLSSNNTGLFRHSSTCFVFWPFL